MARRSGRRYQRPFRPNSLWSLVVVLVLVAFSAWRIWWEHSQTDAPAVLAEGIHRVERVVDGDTLVLAGQARVRLIGADTPETVMPNHSVEPWGPEAAEFTKRFVSHGQVRLEFDGDRQDQYGRFLAYVWVDHRMLNEELIREGLAHARTNFNYSQAMKNRFRRAENEARAAGRAIWSGATLETR